MNLPNENNSCQIIPPTKVRIPLLGENPKQWYLPAMGFAIGNHDDLPECPSLRPVAIDRYHMKCYRSILSKLSYMSTFASQVHFINVCDGMSLTHGVTGTGEEQLRNRIHEVYVVFSALSNGPIV